MPNFQKTSSTMSSSLISSKLIFFFFDDTLTKDYTMNVILVTHLQTIRNCDAKNLSAIIDDYAQYTDLEELFHEAIVERSLKTGF